MECSYCNRYSTSSLFTAFLAVIVLGSCREKRKVHRTTQSITDNTFFFQDSNSYETSALRLSIANASSASSTFYITPLEVDLYNSSAIVKSLLEGIKTPEEKAIRMWNFIREFTYHTKAYSGSEHFYHNPTILVNGLRGGLCDGRNSALANLAKSAGFPARIFNLNGHVVPEIFYENSWHLFDADKNIFYRKPNGEIADVAYLEKHPELISAYTANFTNILQKIRNERTRSVIQELPNEIETRYSPPDTSFNTAVTLPPAAHIKFEVTRANWLKKVIDIYFWEENKSLYDRLGVLAQTLSGGFFKVLTDESVIVEQHLPYPMTSISIKSKQSQQTENFEVFYSTDREQWYFKGIIANGVGEVKFQTFNANNIPFTFKYYLRLVPSLKSKLPSDVLIRTEFTFSDKILLNNAERAFKIVPLSKLSGNLIADFLIVE